MLPIFDPLTSAWLGALIVLLLNTSAYTAEIFFGALITLPKGEIEAAEAFGLSNRQKFVRIELRNMLRLSLSAYINEAIFLFHATTLVFFSAFPTKQQRGDALYYANYFADKTFNPFIPYPILAFYFIILTLVLVLFFGRMNFYLNKHLPVEKYKKLQIKINLIR